MLDSDRSLGSSYKILDNNSKAALSLISVARVCVLTVKVRLLCPTLKYILSNCK